jgi:membrane protease YdiL (CAAX protease family)
MRRVAGKVPEPVLPDIGLRHAWYAMAMAVVLAPLVAVGIFLPEAISEIIDGEFVQSPHLFSMMLWSTLASLLVMLPLLYRLRMPQWLGPWPDLKGMLPRVLGCYLLAFGVGVVTTAATALMNEAGIETGTSSFAPSLLHQGFAQYGALVTFLLVAVLVPVFEEWVFRGVLLAGFSRHLSFGWANVLQAVLFTLIHDDLSKSPFYFAFGLLAGWLVRRYRYLLPAIALHMLNNGVAVWLGAG